MICCTTVKSKTRFFLPPPLSSHNPSFDQFHVAPFSYLLKFSKFSKQNQAMMFISSKTCRFALVLAAASSISVTAVLRGTAPTTNDATPDEHGRRLMDPFTGSTNDLSVVSGASLVFTHPPTQISKGGVCGESSFTGLESDVVSGVFLDYTLLDAANGQDAYRGNCGTGTLATSLRDALAKPAEPIIGELGNLIFAEGTYSAAALTVAANTVVTLDGCDGNTGSSCTGGSGANAMFLFQSDSYLVTGASTRIELTGGAQAKNVLFAITAAATTGAAPSELHGSILSGAAITLGAGSKVGGYVLASAALTAGALCELNTASLATSPIQAVITSAGCPDRAQHACNGLCQATTC
jgi:hypothetical protein